MNLLILLAGCAACYGVYRLVVHLTRGDRRCEVPSELLALRAEMFAELDVARWEVELESAGLDADRVAEIVAEEGGAA